MERDQIEETLSLVREGTKEWEDAMVQGRALVDESTRQKMPALAAEHLRRAVHEFQAAIALNPARDEGYGWLARAYRLLAQATRPKSEDTATFYLRCAAAIAWEGKCRTPAFALSVFTKQEAKTLLAWVRTTRRLDPRAGEIEMNSLRVEFLTSALDPDTIADTLGDDGAA
jgi:hypothetical protein